VGARGTFAFLPERDPRAGLALGPQGDRGRLSAGEYDAVVVVLQGGAERAVEVEAFVALPTGPVEALRGARASSRLAATSDCGVGGRVGGTTRKERGLNVGRALSALLVRGWLQALLHLCPHCYLY